MLANYGYKDGSGDYFITVNTEKCDGCGKCVEACPGGVLEVGENEADPLRDEPVARVTDAERKKIGYTCGVCKTYLTPMSGAVRNAEGIAGLPCVSACQPGAIDHSW